MQKLMFGLVGLGALLLAACGGGGSSATGGGPASCTLPSGTQTVLVYPAPGATGIPDNVSQIVLGSTTALPAGFQARLVITPLQNAFNFNAVATAALPLPSPAATPSFANPVYQSSTNPGATISPGQTVTVYLNNSSAGCTLTQSFGSFTVL